MKKVIAVLLIVICASGAVWAEEATIPSNAFGLLTVPSMTRGELFWLQGRVGEGKYVSVDSTGIHCSIDVPVAVGSIRSSGIGISNQQGLSIVVTSAALSNALLAGERIDSRDWSIASSAHNTANDGYVVTGIESEEGFVLHSKRRWVSWLLNDKPTPVCL